MTFFIAMFILLMQFLWKYIDDLVGKGLDWNVIAELLVYAAAGLVPMALPLSTLLASLMTMGNLGENNELLAMKSAGISLPRIISPLIVVTLLISVSAFFFANNVLPYTNLKISTLLYSVKNQKPELAIKEGVFTNLVEGYSIKVGEKNPGTGLMKRIMIYNHSTNDGNVMVTLADSGYMQVTKDEKHLIATLYSGYSYEEMREGRALRRTAGKKFPQRKQKFSEQVIIFQLEGFGLQRTDEELFKNNYQVMNIGQLKYASDSLTKEFVNRGKGFYKNIIAYNLFKNPYKIEPDTLKKITYKLNGDSLFNTQDANHQRLIVSRALGNARSTKSYITSTNDELLAKQKFIARHKIEWNRKFSLSFACLVFFLIGAPLGAIIRKGGLGMPVVVSVLFFVIYYVIDITGVKFARELYIEPATGMWLSSFILLPLGVFLSYKATNDSVIMNADFYIEAAKKFLTFRKLVKQKVQKAVNKKG